MRILATLTAAVLLFFVTAAVPVFAQQDEKPAEKTEKSKDEAKPQQQDKEKPGRDEKATKPEERRDQAPARDDHARPEASRPQENNRPGDMQRQDEHNNRPAEMQRNDHQHPAQAQKGKHIPDEKFRSSFGRQHTFRVQRTQVINVSQPVVVYGGYSFQLVDTWPSEWAFDDPCYIDYVDDGYFLFDELHPGIRIAVFVVE